MKILFNSFFFIANTLLVLTGCDKNDGDNIIPEPQHQDTFNIYPKPTGPATTGNTGYAGWVGDVMPHYIDGKFHLFFLHDAPDMVKQSSAGQHPIHQFTTSDLVNYNYEGEAIPYGDVSAQDNLIGTGSVIKANNTYYFYYTGHNGSSSWLQNNNPGWATPNSREAVMYATSTDLKNWTKKGFSLKAPQGFNMNEFRDPYVFFNNEFDEYWMLVSAQQSGKGVLLVYKTNDPASDNWQVLGTLNVEGNYLMLECSDIFKWGNQYYMLFAEDWSDTPGTHYRVAHSTAGPWTKPAGGNDMFDGHQFYAGRMASDGTKYYAFGWAHRRNPENDNGTRTWAGNLISHELVLLNNGNLGVKTPESVQAYFDKTAEISIKGQDGATTQSGANYTIDGTAAAAGYQFGEIKGTVKISGSINFSNTTGTASVGFNAGTEKNGTYLIRFEPASKRIAAYNNGSEITRVPFNFEAGKDYSFSLIIDNSVAALYLNNEVALTNRIYRVQDNAWSLRADNMKIVVNDLKISSH